jgi:hypothetical protein
MRTRWRWSRVLVGVGACVEAVAFAAFGARDPFLGTATWGGHFDDRIGSALFATLLVAMIGSAH